jgi:mono/diheme cytochrome c family protein
MRVGRRLVVGVLLALILAVQACGGTDDTEGDAVARGEVLFASNCVVCHGEQAMGNPNGPPLVHELYAADVYSNEEFRAAVNEGVPERHWDFGEMPSMRGLSDQQIDDIIAYVHERQRAAGLID